MSFLLGFDQAFPLGSVWGSEDHMPFERGGGMGDFRKKNILQNDIEGKISALKKNLSWRVMLDKKSLYR